MIDIQYDLSQVHFVESDNPYRRFADLLPVKDSTLLPQAEYTPTIHAKELGQYLGIPWLYLKNDTVSPTGSTKDRMAAVSLAFLWEHGVRTFCTSSTGNSSTAYARAIKFFPEMRLHLFTAEGFEDRVQYTNNDQIVHFVLRDASFVEAFAFAGAYARRNGFVSESGFFNPGRREGLKLAFLEASEQVPRPIDWYVQATSSAMGVYGTYKAAKELFELGRIKRTPHLMCVQQDTCAPLVRAFSENSPQILPKHIVKHPRGIAQAILRGDPTRTYPYVRRIVLESDGDMLAVDEDSIREARGLMRACEGIEICYSAATAVAGLMHGARNGRIPKGDTILINLTGRDRESGNDTGHVRWLQRDGESWVGLKESA